MPPKGVSNNPAGRPPKARALTALLEKTGNKTVRLTDGRSVSGKRLLARALWEGITTKTITFPDGTKYELPPSEWMTLVQFVYKHIDGPPPAALDITSKGESIAPETMPPSQIAATVAALMAAEKVTISEQDR